MIKTAIIGDGRMGRSLSAALRAAGHHISGPHGRCSDGAGAGAVLLCVPDAEIGAAAAHVAEGRLVGHVSGATTLAPLAPHEAFSVHPLMTVTSDTSVSPFAGAGAAIAGSTDRALAFAGELASALGLRAFEVPDAERAAYHAAASIASNFLVTLQAAAERLLPDGTDRDVLVPLVRQTVENWAALGPERALTGPIARGDEATVALQRDALEDRAPALVPLFDALAQATRELAAGARA